MKKLLMGVFCFYNLSAMIVSEPGEQGQPLLITLFVKVFDAVGLCVQDENFPVKAPQYGYAKHGYVQHDCAHKNGGYGTIESSVPMRLPVQPVRQGDDITQ